jgi:hypothetical protein
MSLHPKLLFPAWRPRGPDDRLDAADRRRQDRERRGPGRRHHRGDAGAHRRKGDPVRSQAFRGAPRAIDDRRALDFPRGSAGNECAGS